MTLDRFLDWVGRVLLTVAVIVAITIIGLVIYMWIQHGGACRGSQFLQTWLCETR